MAAEAEAAREARAKVIAAEGEMKASRALKDAADIMSESPAALQVSGSLPIWYQDAFLNEYVLSELFSLISLAPLPPNAEHNLCWKEFDNHIPTANGYHHAVFGQVRWRCSRVSRTARSTGHWAGLSRSVTYLLVVSDDYDFCYSWLLLTTEYQCYLL